MNIQAAAAQLQRFTQFLSAAKDIAEVLKVAADAEASVESLASIRATLQEEVQEARSRLQDLRLKLERELTAGREKIDQAIAAHRKDAKSKARGIEDDLRGVITRAARLRQEAEDARQDKDDALTYRQAEIEQSDCLLATLQTAAGALKDKIASLSG